MKNKRSSARLSNLILPILLGLALTIGAASADEPKLDSLASETLEHRIVQVLNAEQLAAYTAGIPATEIVLPGGETLATFIGRTRREMASGWLIRPLAACTVFNSWAASSNLAVGEKHTLTLRGPDVDYSAMGGASTGCGIPGLRGGALKTNTARGVLLSVEVRGAQGAGELKLWAAGRAEPEASAVSFDATGMTRVSPLIVPLCDDESLAPCADGDLALAIVGAGAHVKLNVLGVLLPAVAAPGLDETFAAGSPASKANAAEAWVRDDTTGVLHYQGGPIGIGTLNTETLISLNSGRGGGDVGIAQGNLGGNNTLEFTTADAARQQATRLLIRGGGDNASAEFYRGSSGNEKVSLMLRGDTGHLALGTKAAPSLLTLHNGHGTSAGLTQGNVGGQHTLELLTSDAAKKHATRVLLRGGSDFAHTEFYSGASGSEILNMIVRGDTGNVGFGIKNPQQRISVAGSIELTGNILPTGDLCIGQCN